MLYDSFGIMQCMRRSIAARRWACFTSLLFFFICQYFVTHDVLNKSFLYGQYVASTEVTRIKLQSKLTYGGNPLTKRRNFVLKIGSSSKIEFIICCYGNTVFQIFVWRSRTVCLLYKYLASLIFLFTCYFSFPIFSNL